MLHAALNLGLGSTFRDLCPVIIGVAAEFDCHNYPHDYYAQLPTETSIIGLVTCSLMIISIYLGSLCGLAKNRANVVAVTAFVVPFGFFFPMQSIDDFFWSMEQYFHVECSCAGSSPSEDIDFGTEKIAPLALASLGR